MSERSSPRHRQATGLKTFLFGCAYYPEHDTPEDRFEDPARLAAAGVNVVRMGEFAWDRLEPREGQYDFSFFDEQIHGLCRLGVMTIMCTPTAAPPAWLSARRPEILRADANGVVQPPGSRQHACVNSPVFRRHSRQITAAMARHYADNHCVLGWQIDNELNCHFALCHCPSCVQAFRQWCRRRYHDDIAALNDAWGHAFWSATLDDFDQIVLPTGRPAPANPSHQLDYYRFVSDSACDFLREQVEILRLANPDWFITHNGLMQHVDYAAMSRHLTFLSVDHYPANWSAAQSAAFMDRTRAYAGNFVVAELQAGPGAQANWMHPTPPPGQMRLWAYQAIAHGADGILHFRWRTCRFGAEAYWCGILDHDNQPRRRYEEFSHEGHELRHIQSDILSTRVHMSAAVLIQHDQHAAHEALPLGRPSPLEQAQVAHNELWRRKLAVGMVEGSDSFEGLKLLIVPSFTIMDADLAERLTEFVRAGGILVATAWTGTRDRHNRVIHQTPPGLLGELFGATVEEYGVLAEGGNEIALSDGPAVAGHNWYEMLYVQSASPAGFWQKGHYAGTAAVTCNALGNGQAFYIGTYLSPRNAAELLDSAVAAAGLWPLVPSLPDAVEVVRRTGDAHSLLFLLNHGSTSQTISNLPTGTDLVTSGLVAGELVLAGREVAIIKTQE